MNFYKVNGKLVISYEKLNEELLNVKNVDGAYEKHVPVVAEENGEVIIKVGEVIHPMNEEHFISDIVIVTKDAYHHFKLKPEDEPIIKLKLNIEEIVNVYEYCTLHGLWSIK